MTDISAHLDDLHRLEHRIKTLQDCALDHYSNKKVALTPILARLVHVHKECIDIQKELNKILF